jgi:hypothetical protein
MRLSGSWSKSVTAGLCNDLRQADLGGRLVGDEGLGRGTVDAGQIKHHGPAPVDFGSGSTSNSVFEKNAALSARAAFGVVPWAGSIPGQPEILS